MSPFTSVVKRVMNKLNSFSIILGSLVVMFLMLGISIASLSRYFFGHPLGWVDEFSGFAMLLLAFLGAPEVLKRHGHVNIDLFIRMLSQRKRFVVDITTSLFGTALSMLLFWYGMVDMVDGIREKAMTNSVYQIPEVVLLWVIPLGGVLLAAGFIRDARNDFRSLKSWEDTKD